MFELLGANASSNIATTQVSRQVSRQAHLQSRESAYCEVRIRRLGTFHNAEAGVPAVIAIAEDLRVDRGCGLIVKRNGTSRPCSLQLG